MQEYIMELALRHPLKMVFAGMAMVLVVTFAGYGIQNIVFPWIGGWER